jgi:Tfp pilus assembly protein PilV
LVHVFRFRRDLREEAGYSLVEVLFAIMLLTIALLPMVGMFDMGIKSATSSGNYDKARTLANLKMEEAKSLPFVDATDNFTDNFPVDGSSTPDADTGYYNSGFIPESGTWSAEFTNFEYRVEKQYMEQPDPTVDDPSGDFEPSSTATNLIRVTVTVRWLADDGDTYNEYKTYGLVAA